MKTFTPADHEFHCDIEAPCFSALDPEEMSLIKSSKTQVMFRKGETLIKQGAFASYILFILEGISKQYIEGEGTRNLNLRLVSPGEFAGLSAVFTDKKFSYSVTSLTDTRVFLIETDAITQLARKNAAFGFRLISRYCTQNTGLFRNLHDMAYKQLNGRLAGVLLYINSLNQVHQDVFSLLTRKDIADFAGMSTESAVKTLKSYEKDGLIELNEKSVRILRLKELEDIARVG